MYICTLSVETNRFLTIDKVQKTFDKQKYVGLLPVSVEFCALSRMAEMPPIFVIPLSKQLFMGSRTIF